MFFVLSAPSHILADDRPLLIKSLDPLKVSALWKAVLAFSGGEMAL